MRLQEIVNINANFKNAINLYLNLNKEDKVQTYIPTKSSVDILKIYLESVENNVGKASILIGPYGKGKSHLVLILLAILSKEIDSNVIQELIERIELVDKAIANDVKKYIKSKKKILPVIIPNTQDDLRQTFMIALNDALKRVGLTDLRPDTYFSEALKTISNWKSNYRDTYEKFCSLLTERETSIKEFENSLKACDGESLSFFKEIYPGLTSGSEFNPLAGGDVLIMYKSVAEAIKDYGYSGVFIVFDEFSKYIESQDKKASGNNMELIQQICELSDESKEQQIFISLIAHKAIKEYEGYLSRETINAFLGIEGRIREIDFVTSSKNNYELIKNALSVNEKKLKEIPNQKAIFGKEALEEYYTIPAFKTNFLKEDFERIVLKGCYPMNPVSAYTLLNISERVAQNERTLFTFISKDERYSLAHFVNSHSSEDKWLIGSDYIYDYFKSIFKKDISEESIHGEWLNAEYALKKADSDDEKSIIKTIAVLNIINKVDEVPANAQMIRLASGISSAEELVLGLEERKILYKNQTNGCYRFKTRAGAALKKEIQKRRELKQNNVNYSDVLLHVSEKKYILPKQYNYHFAMTRYYNYQFMQIEDFLTIGNINSVFDKREHIDGKVFALYSLETTKEYLEKIEQKLKESSVKNLVVIVARSPFTLLKQAMDIDIIREIKSNASFISENEVYGKELIVMEEDLELEISKYIDDNFGKTKKRTIFYNDGNEWIRSNEIDVERAVDISCSATYTRTLRINNELINKQFITTAPIRKARKTIIDGLLNKNLDEKFINGTGPESTIYRAVIINSCIDKDDKPTETKRFLDLFTKFLDSSVEKKVPFEKLTEKYFSAPFGMRAGILPIIVAYVISYRNEDVIIYNGDKEVELNSDTIIRMCDNPEDYYLYISKDDAKKETYLKSLIRTFDPDCYASLTGTRISNVYTCMQRWYRSLPQVTKNLKTSDSIISDQEILDALPKFRKLLQRADGNAYEIVFVDFPEMCKADGNLDKTAKTIANIKTLLSGYYNQLLDMLVIQTTTVFDSKSKDNLIHVLQKWYKEQSDSAKNGLQDSNVTAFMNVIKGIDTFDETEVIQRIAKVVSGVYIDAWEEGTIEQYLEKLTDLKNQIEHISDDTSEKGKMKISLSDADGNVQHRFFESASDPAAAILKNILNDTLEDFSNISLNDRVAILTEVLSNIMNKEV